MTRYKIKVPDTVAGVQITDLFECLGANKPVFEPSNATHIFLEGNTLYYIGDGDEVYFNEQDHIEIDYDDLNAMVFLKDTGKEVATHFMSSDTEQKFYVTSKNTVFFYNTEAGEWVKSGVRLSEIEPIENIKLIEDYLDGIDLIRGTIAIQHVIEGNQVEWARASNPKFWREYTKTTAFSIQELTGGDFLFRLKEETFMIGEDEVPVPVAKPELNKVYWFIDGQGSSKGYDYAKWDNPEFKFPLACWDSENKIKKVVAALGKLLQPKPLQYK